MSDSHDEPERGQRRTARPVWIGAGALLIGVLAVGTWYAALRSSRESGTPNAPVPGPSASPERDRQTPLQVSLANGTDIEHLEEYVAAFLRAAGRLIRPDAGYEIREEPLLDSQVGTHRVSEMFFAPARRDAALVLRQQMFPRAKLRPALPGGEDVVGVIIGEDFAQAQEDNLLAFTFIRDFMNHRLEGSGAEPFLSEQALNTFRRGDDSLSLYWETSAEQTFEVIGWYFWTVFVRIETEGSDAVYEVFGMDPEDDDELLITGVGLARNSHLRFLGLPPDE